MFLIEEVRVFKEGDDLVEHWIFNIEIPKLVTTPEGPTPDNKTIELMQKFYDEKISPREADYPLIAAIKATEHQFFPAYGNFGKTLEVRYVDALKNVFIE